MLLFSSPCNPTGSVFNKKELQAIANVIAKHPDIYIVSDEIYEYINFSGKHVSIGAFENVKNQTITVNGFSKGYSMTGWRIGYIGAPLEVAAACEKIQGQVTSGASSFGQIAAAFALTHSNRATDKMRKQFKKRRDLVIRLMSEIEGVKVNHPDGAFYLFPDISYYFGKSDGTTMVKDADDFCDYLMLKAFVGVVSGSAFGEPNCFRLSYAASEEQLTEAIRRIKVALGKLK